jgi:F-type H+-transporting ATPase subunit delta
MSLKKVAGRYAKSLISLASEKNVLDSVLSDMKGLIKMFENRDLNNLLKSPIVSVDKKRAVFKSLFDPHLSDLTRSFVHLVLTKGRESVLSVIAQEFIEQYNELKGITKVEITSATPLDKSTTAQITDRLLNSNLGLKTIELSAKVNPEIIGGLIIQIGDKLIDDSVAFKLKKISKQFEGKEYVKAI